MENKNITPEEIDHLKEVMFLRMEQLKTEQAHMREIVKLMNELSDKALKIGAAEYERRLELLNGEAERLRKMQETYLPRELFETMIKGVIGAIVGIIIAIIFWQINK
jgi:hypothetical protein